MSEKPKKRKPVALALCRESNRYRGGVIVACDDGSIWCRAQEEGKWSSVWERFPDIPQEEWIGQGGQETWDEDKE